LAYTFVLLLAVEAALVEGDDWLTPTIAVKAQKTVIAVVSSRLFNGGTSKGKLLDSLTLKRLLAASSQK
jgi:hypothetical protein